MKKIVSVAVVLLPLIGASCRLLYEKTWLRDIVNYPEWVLYGGEIDTPWMAWQNEDGVHPISALLSPEERGEKKEFAGFFRIHEPIGISFSDGSSCTFLYWMGTSDYYNTDIVIPQPDPEVFEFDARIHNSYYGQLGGGYFEGDGSPPADEPVIMVKARYEFLGETEESYRCRFILTLDSGGVLIDTEWITQRTAWFKGNDKPDWLPDVAHEEPNTTPLYDYRVKYLGPLNYVTYISGPLAWANPYISLRQEEIDNTQKRILYSVYGSPPDSDLYYIEVHVHTSETPVYRYKDKVVYRFMDRDRRVLDEEIGWYTLPDAPDYW